MDFWELNWENIKWRYSWIKITSKLLTLLCFSFLWFLHTHEEDRSLDLTLLIWTAPEGSLYVTIMSKSCMKWSIKLNYYSNCLHERKKRSYLPRMISRTDISSILPSHCLVQANEASVFWHRFSNKIKHSVFSSKIISLESKDTCTYRHYSNCLDLWASYHINKFA